MDRQELFCVWPFAKTEMGGQVLFDPRRGRLMRPANECGQRFSYELKTSAFEDGAQSPFVPADDLVNVYPMLQLPVTDGQSDVPGLAAQAERWIQASGLPEEDRVGRARYLERQLRDSGRFQYSLKGQQRDLNVDPIEDFVTNHPQGHCEYFATALALMLRSQDIPSRLVVGYRTEEFNRVGRFYQVRQWHAHAWVEIYLGPQHLPEELFRGEEHWEWAAGGWLRLDPTPGGTAGQAEAGESWIDKAERSLTWFQSLWGNYVMEMDRSRQREAIYQPAADWIKGVAERLSDPRWWRDTLVGLVRGAWQFLLDWIGGDWLSWRGLVALAILGAVVLVIGRLVLVLFRWLLRRMKGETDEKARAALARVVFYRRMETALARRGLVRSATQTQYEFAKEAGAALAQSTGRAETAQLPVRVAEAFYRVRFGEATLDKQQTEEVEQALVELERKDDRVSG